MPSGAGCSGDPGAGGCSESEERQAFLTGSMRAEGEGTVESTQEKMEGHPFFWKEKEDSGCRHIRKQQEEYRETVASGAFRGKSRSSVGQRAARVSGFFSGNRRSGRQLEALSAGKGQGYAVHGRMR